MELAVTRDDERHFLCVAKRLPVATVAGAFPAASDDLWLVRALARCGVVGKPQPNIADARARARGSRGQSVGRRDRLPIGDDHGKLGAARLRRRQENQGPQAARLGGHGQAGVGCSSDAASRQDREGAVPLLHESRGAFPFIERVFADSAHKGERVANATRIVVEIVNKLPNQVGLTVLPRRWVVERFFAWINRNRRLAKDFEGTLKSATAFIYAAAVLLLIRRLARAA